MKVFCAWAIDHVEGLTAAALMSDNIAELKRVSQDVRHAVDAIKAWSMAVGGSPVLDLGSIGCVEVPADKMTDVPAIAKKFEDTVEATLSIGVGMTIAEATSAMKFSQREGGDRISLYEPEMDAALSEHDAAGADPLAGLAKSGKVGSEQLVGAADGPEDQQSASSDATPPPDPQKGEAQPAEMHSAPAGGGADQASASAGPAPEGSGSSSSSEGSGGEGDGQEEDPRATVINALKQIKAQADVLEQMKQTNPEAFEAVKSVVAAMIIMAQGMAQEGEQQEAVSKSESLSKGSVIPFPGNPAPRVTQPAAGGATVTPLGAHNVSPHGAHLDLGVSFHEKGDPSTALTHYAQAMKMAPNEPRVHFNTGVAHEDLGHHAQAIHHYQTAVKLDPEFADAHFNLARLYHAAKNDLGAQHHLSQYHKHLPAQEAREAEEATWHKGAADFPVGTIKNGKVKIEHTDTATGAQTGSAWRSVRAGQVMSEDGHAISSRNPNGK